MHHGHLLLETRKALGEPLGATAKTQPGILTHVNAHLIISMPNLNVFLYRIDTTIARPTLYRRVATS
eukprot:COSAG05_NODE_22121_length_267_cov_0.607143_1_plen_66_part_01